ncbi:MAG: hypothetical protein HC782_01080, partial [Gammaproteobacteria bacterium]|nr:hypothetical protein [Gammaproteobacteria bacterium]
MWRARRGTAKKLVNGQYADNIYLSSFVGYGPVSNPRFIIAITVDEPAAGKIYGGDVSAPADDHRHGPRPDSQAGAGRPQRDAGHRRREVRRPGDPGRSLALVPGAGRDGADAVVGIDAVGLGGGLLPAGAVDDRVSRGGDQPGGIRLQPLRRLAARLA